MAEPAAPTVVGRYVLHAPIARGGMATIHLARLLGAEGFSRTVAAKRLHPQFTEDAEFVSMFLDEARIASKLHHPNVVPVLDVIQTGAEVILVQEYVHGVPFDKLLRAANQQKTPLPVEVAITIVTGMLAGLSAAHEAKDELGESLEIVHRDVSPQNVLVGVDGVPRLLDFGVAKAAGNLHVTRAGVFKGKMAYTSPEQLRGVVTRSTDLYASAVVLWEALAGRRLHVGLGEPELIAVISSGAVEKLTSAVDRASVTPERWELIEKLEPIVRKGMAFAPGDRYATAEEMVEALLHAAPAATAAEVSKWVKLLGKVYLEGREKLIVAEESSWRKQKSGSVSTSSGESAERLPPGLSTQPSSPASSLGPSLLAPAPEPARKQWAVVAALLLISGLLAGIFVLLLRRPVASPAASAAPAAIATASAAPAQAAQAPVAAASEAAAPPSSAAASTDAGRSPIATAQAAAPRPVHAAPVVPVAAPTTPPPNCNPPFYFEGTKKIFKPACL